MYAIRCQQSEPDLLCNMYLSRPSLGEEERHCAQELGQAEKAQEYGMAASRREAAFKALMSVPDRPGVWTDLVIDNAGLLSTGDYDCFSVERVIHS